MYILGINGTFRTSGEYAHPGDISQHDASAILINECGDILAAVEEERLNRIKHTNRFPYLSIQYCLSSQGITLEDVDYIALPSAQSSYRKLCIANAISDPCVAFEEEKAFIARHFFQLFSFDISEKLRFSEHHEAHAWSAIAYSGFTRSLVLVLDGIGENYQSGLIAKVEGGDLEIIKRYDISQSIGLFYSRILYMLGYGPFDEYKVMGLAPYGDPNVYSKIFEEGVKLLPGGEFSICGPEIWVQLFSRFGILKHARRSGQDFTKLHKDFAAALQNNTQKLVFHILDHYRQSTGLRSLSFAGGVAHNCSINGEIQRSGKFDNFFVQPAAHDAGIALGAAVDVLNKVTGDRVRKKIPHLFFGPHIGSTDSVREQLTMWCDVISFEKRDDICAHAAKLLAGGAVLGWVQGQSEFGPRALGNRSILADPRPSTNKRRINAMIKKREGFRPFAPSVIEEKANEYFDVMCEARHYRFMVCTLQVRDRYREYLGAVTHIDGTARVQIVTKSHSKFWRLINAFGDITGCPIILNTSMNNHAEPIVNSLEDAITCYLTTGLDHLVIDDFIITRRGTTPTLFGTMTVHLPPHRFLEQRIVKNEVSYFLSTSVPKEMSQKKIPISKTSFDILRVSNGRESITELIEGFGMLADIEIILKEMLALWSERAIILAPRRE